MFSISFSIIEMFSSGFLKISVPRIPAGNLFRYFFRATYPRRRRRLRLTAVWTMFFGTTKEILLFSPFLLRINLKFRPEEKINFPFWNIFSISLLPALFFLGSIYLFLEITPWAERALFFSFFVLPFYLFWSLLWLKTHGLWLFFFFLAGMSGTWCRVYPHTYWKSKIGVGVYYIINRLST